MVGTSPPRLLARVRNRWRRHHNRMNLQRRRTARASQDEMGWKAWRTFSLLSVVRRVFVLTFPFHRTTKSVKSSTGPNLTGNRTLPANLCPFSGRPELACFAEDFAEAVGESIEA